nr:small subunit ribosomal protein S3 [uncultured archaeon]
MSRILIIKKIKITRKTIKMIEREFVAQKIREFKIQEFISNKLKNVGHSHTRLTKTPLGEKIIIFTSHPGLIVGRKGETIAELTRALKKNFKLENPQIEISEVEDINLDARIVAERIASAFERFGTNRFKGVLHKTLQDVLNSGAMGVEIVVSGKIPSSRAKTWRVYGGYIKKCGDLAVTQVRRAGVTAKLKTGIVGVKVSIMPPGVKLPDDIHLLKEQIVEEKVSKESAEKKTPAEEKAKEKQEKEKQKTAKQKALENEEKNKGTAKAE